MSFFFNPFPLRLTSLQNVLGFAVDQAQEVVGTSVKNIASKMGTILDSAITNVQEMAQPVTQSIKEKAETAINIVQETASPVIQSMSETAENTLDNLQEIAQPALESMGDFAQSTVNTWWKTVGPSYKEYCPSFIKGTWLCPDEPIHWCDENIQNIYLNKACKAGFSFAENVHEYAQELGDALNVSPNTIYLGAAMLVAVPTIGVLAWNMYKKKSPKMANNVQQPVLTNDAASQPPQEPSVSEKKTMEIGVSTDDLAPILHLAAANITEKNLTDSATQTSIENHKHVNTIGTQTDLKNVCELGTQTSVEMDPMMTPTLLDPSTEFFKPMDFPKESPKLKASRSEKSAIYVSDALKEKITKAWLAKHGEEQVKKENAHYLPLNICSNILYNQISSSNINPAKHILGDRLHLSQNKYLQTDAEVQAYNEVIQALLPGDEILALPKKNLKRI